MLHRVTTSYNHLLRMIHVELNAEVQCVSQKMENNVCTIYRFKSVSNVLFYVCETFIPSVASIGWPKIFITARWREKTLPLRQQLMHKSSKGKPHCGWVRRRDFCLMTRRQIINHWEQGPSFEIFWQTNF